VWALGCIVLQLVTGKVPFDGLQNEFKIYRELNLRSPLEYAKIHFKEDLNTNSMYTKSSEL
jgi:serine/threonine protein kinase